MNIDFRTRMEAQWVAIYRINCELISTSWCDDVATEKPRRYDNAHHTELKRRKGRKSLLH